MGVFCQSVRRGRYLKRRARATAVNGLPGLELAGLDRLRQTVEVDDLIDNLVARGEAATRHPAVDWHLPAFVALDGDAAAGFLALDAAPGRLADAGADASAKTTLRLGSARIVANIFKPHRLYPS